MKVPFNSKISVFKNIFEVKDTPYEMTVTDIHARIKNGYPELIDKINKIRTSDNEEFAAKLKASLLGIMFNGTFSERNDNGLINHSGMCILDFDDYETPEAMQEERERICADRYTLLCFTSPSGNGLKVVIRIPKSDKDEHKRRFSAYGKYINSENFDIKNSNISRVCFESYDPNIYLNQFCEEFTDIDEDRGYTYTERTPICILENEQKKIDIIMGFSFKKDFAPGERNAYIFDLAGLFCEYGIDKITAENYILNNVVIGDFSEREAKTAIGSAYKKRVFDSRFFEDYESVKNVKNKIRSGVDKEIIKKQLNVTEEVINEVKNQLAESDQVFWQIIKDKKGNETISIEPRKYAEYLIKNGFNKYYPENSQSPQFIEIKENKIKLSSINRIKDFVLTMLLERSEISVWNHCSKSVQLFNENFLNMIEAVNLTMLKDDKDTSYFPFRNGIAKVTKNDIKLIPYIDCGGYVWEEHIIQHDFRVETDHFTDFTDFITKISGSEEIRTEAFKSALGYILHNFKSKTDQKAIIFNDQEVDDNPNGGSGKSLMLDAINRIRKIVKIDGKLYDPKKSDFVYQRVSLDTQVLAFDDVKKNFNFEQLFPLITEGITINRKNKEEIFVPFERSPKIIITTNYVISGSGDSHERRRHEVEVFQYFNAKRNPRKEYGRLLFDDWTEQEFNKFYNFMLSNVQLHLNKGLIKYQLINGDIKRFIQNTHKDFYDWCIEENIPTDKRIYNSEVIRNFCDEHKNWKDLSSKVFLKWVEKWAEFKGYVFEKDRDINGRYFVIHSETSPF